MEDLAVQEPSSGTLVCVRCFALLSPGAEFCGECGAPISDEPTSEGSDKAIYPELARANLMRMRGDYKGAEEVCLGILRRFPNNATANGLLGDICAERGDLEQASEWYELALDLTPDDEAVQGKLANVKGRLREHEAAETAKQLGLPSSRPKVGFYVAGVILFLIGTGVLAYVLGRQAERRGMGDNEVVVPLTIKPPEAGSGSNENAVPSQAQDQSSSATSSEEDRARLQSVLNSFDAEDPARSRLLDVRIDPRTDQSGPFMLVTFELKAGEDPRSFAMSIASAAFKGNSDVSNAIVRGVRLGKLAYVANANRGESAPTLVREWSADSRPTDANAANPVESHEAPPASNTGATGTSGTGSTGLTTTGGAATSGG